jgi:hypothetical protein
MKEPIMDEEDAAKAEIRKLREERDSLRKALHDLYYNAPVDGGESTSEVIDYARGVLERTKP